MGNLFIHGQIQLKLYQKIWPFCWKYWGNFELNRTKKDKNVPKIGVLTVCESDSSIDPDRSLSRNRHQLLLLSLLFFIVFRDFNCMAFLCPLNLWFAGKYCFAFYVCPCVAKLNIGYIFCIIWPTAFKLSMCLPCDKTLPANPTYLTLRP